MNFDLERKAVVYSDTTIGFLDACDKYDDQMGKVIKDGEKVWINGKLSGSNE